MHVSSCFFSCICMSITLRCTFFVTLFSLVSRYSAQDWVKRRLLSHITARKWRFAPRECGEDDALYRIFTFCNCIGRWHQDNIPMSLWYVWLLQAEAEEAIKRIASHRGLQTSSIILMPQLESEIESENESFCGRALLCLLKCSYHSNTWKLKERVIIQILRASCVCRDHRHSDHKQWRDPDSKLHRQRRHATGKHHIQLHHVSHKSASSCQHGCACFRRTSPVYFLTIFSRQPSH
jgi:hypothetical protein